jgi:tripartite-type tricarboxylate transporter receptor subunit TctC
MERGEIDGLCNTVTGFDVIRPGWIAQGKFTTLLTFDEKPLPGIDAPSVHKFAKTDEQHEMLRFFNASAALGAPFAAPPGTPAERLQLLRAAFDKAMADPELIAAAERLSLDAHEPMTGAETAALVSSIVNITPAFADKAVRYMGGNR